MFNPNPPLLTSASPNVYSPDEKFQSEIPFPTKTATKITHREHRFWQPFEIGSISGSNGTNSQTIIPGLAAGSAQTYTFDQIPDWYLIAVSSETTARIFVYVGGQTTGIPLRVSAGGCITIPSLGQPYLTIVCRAGTATAFGTIIGMSGYDELLVGKFVPQ